MTNRQRIVCALRGETPDRVPFTAYGWMWGDRPTIAKLVERGLGLTHHYATYARRCPEASFEEETFDRDGHQWRRRVMKTPVGELEELYMGGWRQEFFVKKPEDYRVLEYVARHTVQEPDYEGFVEAEQQVGERGVAIVSAARSPIQDILVDHVGFENFCYHLADDVQELYSCYEALAERFVEMCQIIADGPGEFVKVWENFTAEAFGAERFKELHMPLYRRCSEILHGAGKRWMAHMDGRLARVQDLLPESGLDALESLTPPSEGDVPPERWRQVWPGLVLWVNVPVSWYGQPGDGLASRLRDLLERVDSRKGLLLEVSEDLPGNWAESIPVVLETLEQAGG